MKIAIVILAVICSQNGQVLGVTGGQPSKEGEFPFMVSIRDGYNCHQCGGTIIGDRWVLTSNACYSWAWWGSVSFGTTKTTVPVNYECEAYDSSHQIYIDDVLYNPNAWNMPPWTHDLVLVHLNESIPFGENVQPIQLSGVDEPWPAGKTGTVLGWSGSGLRSIQPDLQKANVPLYSDEYCSNSSLWGGNQLADIDVQKCGGIINSTYSCLADYGGPLLVDGKQYGIISYVWASDFSDECGGYLGIYSPISYFREWIKDTTGI